MESKAIILIRGIEKPGDYGFDYHLEAQLKALLGKRVFTLDSLSDRTIIPYLQKLVEENEKTCIILDLRISSHLGVGQTILNSFVRNKNLELLCLGESKGVTPFLKLYQGKIFGSENELIDYLSSN